MAKKEKEEETIELTSQQDQSLEIIGNIFRQAIYSGNDILEVIDTFISLLSSQDDEMCQDIVSEFIRYKKIRVNCGFVKKLRARIDVLGSIFLKSLPKGVSITIEYRIKSFESTAKKVILYYLKGKSIDLYDLIAFRAIVDSLASEDVNTSYCYDIKKICIEYFKKVFRCTICTPAQQVGPDPLVKDYIKVPRDGYQSIQIAFKTATSNDTFEAQIRTLKMHEQAEVGEAAHNKYKDNKYKAIEKHIWFDCKKVHIPSFRVLCNGSIFDKIGLKNSKHIE